MKYAENGKRSKAWWLQAVKWFGQDSSRGIMRGGEVPTYQVKEALDHLIHDGLVASDGERGKGKKPRYHLTAEGHQYLEEHIDDVELKAAEESAPGPTHKVPDIPQAPVSRIPVDDTPVNAPSTVVAQPKLRTADKIKQFPWCLECEGMPTRPLCVAMNHRLTDKKPIGGMQAPEPAEEPSYDPGRVVAVKPKAPRARKLEFAEAFRETLVKILLERYADQVTAKEVMEVLENDRHQ